MSLIGIKCGVHRFSLNSIDSITQHW